MNINKTNFFLLAILSLFIVSGCSDDTTSIADPNGTTPGISDPGTTDPGSTTDDTDDDGLVNSVDDDDDGDGILDVNDAFPLDSNETVDTDGDGIGNNTDADDDGDGVVDSQDAFPLDSSESLDTDGDGIGNNTDSDDDGDGILDVNDAFSLNPAETIDTDGDGTGNNADADDDGDGVEDSLDAFPLDSTKAIAPSLDISLTLKVGSASTDADTFVISAVSPGYLTMLIVDENSVAVENQIVSVSTTLANAVPTTVLTDASGSAQVRLDFLNNLGADTVVATALLDSTNFTGSLNYGIVAPSIQLGDDSGTFISGQLEISPGSLSAGGNASVSAYLVDNASPPQPFLVPVEVNFTSVCASLQTPLASIDATVISSSGVASAAYKANGCIGDDTITATLAFGGAEFTATGTITVASDQAGSIKFVSADPQAITLQGAGGAGFQETSTLTFQVVDTSGNPLKDQNVEFSVNGDAGGLTINPTSAITDENGEAFTIVQAGGIPLVVNIIATVEVGATKISTQSTGLVVSGGLPDDDSFTLSATDFNPEGFDFSGETTEISVFLSDIFNNPPPEGTPVFFTTEGGTIGSSCSTNTAGSCSVTWTSANPRPVDGRSTVLAYTQGVESFIDEDGDGKLSDSEAFSPDLAEVYRDDDEGIVFNADGSVLVEDYDVGEFFVDFDKSGTHNAADGEYNGNLCDDTTSPLCSTQQSLNISRSLVLTMSTSSALISAANGATTLADQTTDDQARLDIDSGRKEVTVTYSDTNNQPLPIDTTIIVTTDDGKLAGKTSVTQINSNSAGTSSFTFTLEDDDLTKNDTGTVTITVSTPNNFETVISFPVDS